MTSEIIDTARINLSNNENFNENQIYKDNDSFESPLKQNVTDNEIMENTQFPLVSKKSGRHQLYPFSTTSMISNSAANNENTPELILRVETLGSEIKNTQNASNALSIEDGTQSDPVLPIFPVVTNKPGRHQMHPFSTAPFLPSTSSTSVTDVPNEEQTVSNKRGTLSRMLKNFKGTNKFLHNREDSTEREIKSKDIPTQLEGNATKSSAIGKMLNKMNSVSKESKTNISKAIHRISDAFSSTSKQNKKDTAVGGKSSPLTIMTTKEKCASLSRKVSSLGSHFSRMSLSQGGETTNEQKQSRNHDSPSEGKIATASNAKANSDVKTSTLNKKIGTPFLPTIPYSGSGEVTNIDVKNENIGSARDTEQIG